MSYKTVAENSKTLARQYFNKGNFGRAFSHYLVALQLNPEWREQIREEFSTALCKWGTTLDEKKRFNDLFTCYEQAVEIYPNDVVILNNLGAHLLRCGLLKEAAYYFQKCINVDRYFIRASHNLESVANMAVERWHFRMLNDENRNEAFREAILKKVKKGFARILDVGTGTGILSLFCAEGHAKEVYACDSSPIMCDIAKNVFLSNNAHNVKLITKHSTEISIPEDISQKVSLLVTETFDAALLGEDIIRTLTHAWQHLLLPPPPAEGGLNPKFGLVLPFGAVLYCTGIELDSVANDFHLKKTVNSFLLDECNVCRKCDNYDTQDLSRCNFTCLTETKTLLELNFNDPGSFVLDGSRREITLNCITSGRLDCFAVWFDLHLDEDIILNTGPLSKNNSAWDQAVFPLPRSIPLQQQQEITISVAFQNGKLSIATTDDSNGFELTDNAIKLLRNDKLGKVFQEVGGKLSKLYDRSIHILDCYQFPVVGFSFLLRRKNEKFSDKLSCCVATEDERRLVAFLSDKYEIEVEILEKTENVLETLGGNVFDVILLDFVEGSGEIKDGVFMELENFKSHLKPDGILLPQKITVIGQFLHSDWLNRTSKVIDNSVTCGYNIAEFINIYQVRHFIDLELRTLGKTFCTDSFDLFDLFDLSQSVTEKNVPVRSTGDVRANALAYWFRIRFLEGCDEILTNEDGSHHQSAFLFPTTEFYDSVNFNVIRNNGLFSIEMLKS